MKPLIFLLALSAISSTSATAQPAFSLIPQPLPRTVPFNDASGQQVGTATFHGDRMYLRDLNGKHIVTIVLEKDGSQTMYDPSGNILDRRTTPK